MALVLVIRAANGEQKTTIAPAPFEKHSILFFSLPVDVRFWFFWPPVDV